ncbi:hypothetical protein DH2020_027171 [Rehmannia glutinosa]|uniref:RNase H type-1 domain-containing protein n=1 Tax=Rehmannia glutinosa TaxID=99300 RepID=A0ABR0VXU4_REHGL
MSAASIVNMAIMISKIDREDVHCLFAMLMWTLWYACNMLICQGKKLTHQDCFALAFKTLNEYQVAQEPQRPIKSGDLCSFWRCPPAFTIKVNTDASIVKTTGTGIGVIIRDHDGKIIHTLSKKLVNEFRIAIAEAIAYKEGIIEAKKLQAQSVILESDCKQLIQAFHRQETNITYMGYVVDDIRQLSESFSSFSLCYIPRTANSLAHQLAKFAFSSCCNGLYYGSFPNELIHLVHEEEIPP